MLHDTEIATLPANKREPHWRRVLRFWQHKAWRKRTLLFSVLVLPLLAGAAVFGIAYHHYAKVIDAHLRGGPFADSANIYGAAFVLSEGDGVSMDDLSAELKEAGYDEEPGGKPGTFLISGSSVQISPPAGAGEGPAKISMNGKSVARITAGGQPVKSFTLGFPLIANLSAARDKRQIIEFSDIPPVLVHAVISAEDKHFFSHRGLDLPRVIKAASVDFYQGRKAQGASTLTMQLVRGLWLVPEKRWKRKIAEAMMTMHLERTWSKEQIFATYANQVYMGREAAYSLHGFAEAARIYFGKDLKDLSVSEAAMLAGMVQRPSVFNPVRNPERTRQRRDLVLKLMRDNRYIDAGQYSQAVNAPLGASDHLDAGDSLGASYVLDLVADELQGRPDTEDDARDVYTTIDLNLQRAAAEALASGLREVDAQLSKSKEHAGKHAEAALIALDPHTGEIKALIGGRDYAVSQLNRVMSKRPPGSVFKPFVYAAALNTGVEGGNQVFTPASTVDDSQTTFRFGRQTYVPANFHNEHFGTMTLRQALAHSDNVAAVKVAEAVGYGSVVAMARRAGLNENIKPTPAVALGSYDVTPFEMAGAYTAFANGGVRVKPQLIASMKDPSGESIQNFTPESQSTMDPRVAWLMTSMMEDVLRSGTGAGVRSRGFTLPAAGKTGTSHDGWFAGYTSQLLCIVWVGFDDYSELNLEGAKSALPIWTEFMKRATKFAAYRDAREFAQPSGIVSAKICSDSGKLAGEFCPNTRSDVFIAGTDPQQPCDIHSVQAASVELTGETAPAGEPATAGSGDSSLSAVSSSPPASSSAGTEGNSAPR